jgi:hypothetical protein
MMRAIRFFIFFILGLAMSSCVIPVNLNYETAEIRQKGDVAFTGSLSQQSRQSFELQDTNWLPKELGFGVRMDVGVSERSNLSVRYENTFISYDLRQNFIELQWKKALGQRYFDLNKEVKFALGIPMQFYFYEGYEAYILNPRLFITFSNTSEWFRFTLIPKVYIIYDEFVAMNYIHPLFGFGISANCAFSSNFEKWAIMPELGLLGTSSLSFGYGVVYKF